MSKTDLTDIQIKPTLTCIDHLVTHKTFDLHQHKELDILVTQPAPSEAELPSYYESEEYISHTNSSKGIFDRLYQTIKSIALKSKTKLISSYMDKQDSHLDFGAGTGSLIQAMNKYGYSSSGIEPSNQARKVASENGLRLHSSLKDLSGKTFKVITLFHVLEHLPNLHEDLNSLTELLHQNGRLIIAVPNFKSYDARYYKNHWAAYDVPRHLWHFSKTGITQLADQHHMDVIKTKPMWFDSFYVSLLSEQHKTGKRNWMKAIYVGLRSNISAIRTKEYSSIIYILKKKN